MLLRYLKQDPKLPLQPPHAFPEPSPHGWPRPFPRSPSGPAPLLKRGNRGGRRAWGAALPQAHARRQESGPGACVVAAGAQFGAAARAAGAMREALRGRSGNRPAPGGHTLAATPMELPWARTRAALGRLEKALTCSRW